MIGQQRPRGPRSELSVLRAVGHMGGFAARGHDHMHIIRLSL